MQLTARACKSPMQANLDRIVTMETVEDSIEATMTACQVNGAHSISPSGQGSEEEFRCGSRVEGAQVTCVLTTTAGPGKGRGGW